MSSSGRSSGLEKVDKINPYGEKVTAILLNPNVPEARKVKLRSLIDGIEAETLVGPGHVDELTSATGVDVDEALIPPVSIFGRAFDEVFSSHSKSEEGGFARVEDYDKYLVERADPTNSAVIVRSETLGAELSELHQVIGSNHDVREPLAFECDVDGHHYEMGIMSSVEGSLLVHVSFYNPADGRKYDTYCDIREWEGVGGTNDSGFVRTKKLVPHFEAGKYFLFTGWTLLMRLKRDNKHYEFFFDPPGGYDAENDPDIKAKLKFLEPFTIDRIFQLIRDHAK